MEKRRKEPSKVRNLAVNRFPVGSHFFLHLLWLTALCPRSLCQVHDSFDSGNNQTDHNSLRLTLEESKSNSSSSSNSSNSSTSSDSSSLPINPIVLTTPVEISSRARANTDNNDIDGVDNQECFIQGPHGFRQLFHQPTPLSSSYSSSASSPAYLSNENLTVPIAAVIDGLNEYGDSSFKLYTSERGRKDDDNENEVDSVHHHTSNPHTLESSLFRADTDFPAVAENKMMDENNNNGGTNQNSTTNSMVNLYPCWMDLQLARRGQAVARHYFAQINNAHFLSLFLLIGNEQVRRVLFYTGKSNTPEKAQKRYMATVLQVKLWYDEDLKSEHVIKSLLKVRNIHRAVGYKLDTERPDLTQQPTVQNNNDSNGNKTGENSQSVSDSDTVVVDSSSNTEDGTENKEPRYKPKKYMWEAFRRDLEESYLNQTRGNVTNGKKIGKYAYNQFLMSLTQWSFMALPVLYPHKFSGMQDAQPEDLQAFAHLWAVLSYALGMKEEYIICKNSDMESCYNYCKKMLDRYFIPFLFELDEEGEILLESLLKVATYISPQVTEESIMLQLLEDFFGIDCPNLRSYARWQTHFIRSTYKLSETWARPSGFLSKFLNFLLRGQIQVASLKLFGYDGTDPGEVAEKAYYFKK